MDARFVDGQLERELTQGRSGTSASALLALTRRSLPVLFILLCTFLFRSQHFGSPDIDYDEPFYLLAGDKLLHGAIVYTDIWDRKPIGLFLLYAFARLFGGGGFLQYELLAASFAAATAVFIWLISQRYVGRWASTLPALAYILWQEPYYGGGGQAAIFYNLFTATSVWLALRAKDSAHVQVVKRAGALAMLLMGCALQVKYTALPEGVFFGLAFLAILYRKNEPLSAIVKTALAYVALAIAPTGLVAIYYLAIGHFHDFYYANFKSIFDRLRLDPSFISYNLNYIWIVAVPLLICAILGFNRLRIQEIARKRGDHLFLGGWMVAALVGFAMIGNYYFYYFMPVLLPLAVLCAPLFAQRAIGVMTAVLLTLWPLYVSDYWAGDARDRRIASISALTRMIEPHIRTRCLYIFDGPAALYLTTHACIPTRFAYPDHLSNDVERPALGVNAETEMKRIMASRPGVIVTSPRKLVPFRNAITSRILDQTLRAHYYELGSVVHKGRPILVYVLRTDSEKAPLARL